MREERCKWGGRDIKGASQNTVANPLPRKAQAESEGQGARVLNPVHSSETSRENPSALSLPKAHLLIPNPIRHHHHTTYPRTTIPSTIRPIKHHLPQTHPPQTKTKQTIPSSHTSPAAPPKNHRITSVGTTSFIFPSSLHKHTTTTTTKTKLPPTPPKPMPRNQ